MKNRISTFVCLSLVALFLVSCSPNGDGSPQSNNDSTEATTTEITNALNTELESNDTTVEITDASFDLESYKTNASTLKELIEDNYILVGNMATYEVNAFKAYGSVTTSFVDSAFEWLEKNSDHTREEVQENHSNIKQLYAAIITTEYKGKEAEEIDASIRDLYDAYSRMYKCVTEPSGTLSEYGSEISDILSAFDKADETLSLFLG